MKEKLIIKAYELLEDGKSYDSLNHEEQQGVIEVFGSKIEYERMLSLSDIALEEDEIIAPSMTTESALFNEFSKKHDPQKSQEKGVGTFISRYLSNRFFKVAIPSLIVLFGLTFFLNREISNDNAIAESTVTETIENTDQDLRTDKMESEERNSIDGIVAEKKETDSKFKTEDLDISNDQIMHDLVAESREELEIVEDEVEAEAIFDLNANEDSYNKGSSIVQDKVIKLQPTSTLSGTAQERNYTPISNNAQVFTWSDSTVTSIGTFTVQDVDGDLDQLAKESAPVITEDLIEMDNTYGNAVYSATDISSTEQISKGLKQELGKNVSAISNANNDNGLFEFLYTTY